MNSTSKHKAIVELKRDLVGLLHDELSSDGQFVSCLSALARRGQELLHSRQVDISEVQRRDILKEFGRFQTDQGVVDFAHKHRITLPKGSFWWILNKDERPGFIVGLEEQSLGIPRITNGIDVWIERPDGTLFLGHRDWLKYRRKVASRASKPTQANRDASKNGYKPSKREVDMATRLIDQDAIGMFAQRYELVVGKPLTYEPTAKGTFEEDVELLASYVHEHFEALAQKENLQTKPT